MTATDAGRRYAAQVLGLARRLLCDEGDVADVCLEVLRHVVGRLPGCRGQADVGAWLHRATVHAALMRRRRLAPAPVVRRRGPAPAT
jgi:DNA-directed RNA polymerase specialized sigma24 family protein